MKKVARVLGRTYDAALAESGMNNTQFAVLRAVADHSGLPLSRMADALAMERTSLYRALRPMQRDGWVQVTEGEDARSSSATLTRKGAKLLAHAEQAWSRVQGGLLARFGKGAYRSLVRELDRLASDGAG